MLLFVILDANIYGHLGVIPSSVCSLTKLSLIQVNSGSSNPLLTCVPSCISTVATAQVPPYCPTNQDIGLCGLIAATNIHSLSGHSLWNCTTLGTTVTNPCSPQLWLGIQCANSGSINNTVISITFSSSKLIGNKLVQ